MNHSLQRRNHNCLSGLALSLAIMLSALGCGGPDRPPTVKVSGNVTFDGAAPPTNGTIYFNPIAVASGMPGRPGSGEFDAEGNYQVTSFEDGDGLVPGTYSVKVECWKKSSGYTNESEESYVPSGFEPPQLTVEADQDSVVHNVNVSK